MNDRQWDDFITGNPNSWWGQWKNEHQRQHRKHLNSSAIPSRNTIRKPKSIKALKRQKTNVATKKFQPSLVWFLIGFVVATLYMVGNGHEWDMSLIVGLFGGCLLAYLFPLLIVGAIVFSLIYLAQYL